MAVKKEVAPAKGNTEATQIWQSLQRFLAVRDHSSLELEQKLLQKFESSELVKEAIIEAQQKGWVSSDQTLSARLIEKYTAANKSRQYIEAQLQKRELPLASFPDAVEKQKALNLLLSRFGPPESLSPEEAIQAQRFLSYRGFEEHLITELTLKEF